MENGNETITQSTANTQDYIRLPFNIIDTGINLDLIIPKHKDMSSEVVCSICLSMIYDPIMCSKCENIFCRSCIQALLKKSFKCPNKCIFEEKEIGRVLKNLLNKFELQCYYTPNGCSSIVLYSDFPKHCLNCDYANFKCLTKGCGLIGIKKDIIAHVKVCPLKLIECKYCKESIYQKDYVTHISICEVKLVNCRHCGAQMKNIGLEKHMNEDCDMIEIKCSQCYSKFIKKEYKKHDNEDCLLHQVAWWKNKANEYALEIENYKKQLIEAERKNQRYINISAKLLENPSNLVKENVNNVIRHNFNLFEDIEGYQGNNSNMLFSGLYRGSNVMRDNNFCFNIINKSDSILNGSIHSDLDDNNNNNDSLANNSNNTNNNDMFNISTINNKYKIDQISSKETLSGVVYSIIDLSPYLSGLICCGNFNSISFFQMPSLESKFSLEGHTNYIWSLIHLTSFKLNYIASGSQDTTIKLWDITLKQCVFTFRGHESWVVSLSQFNHCNIPFLLSTSHDNTLCIWELPLNPFLTQHLRKVIPNVYGKLCGNTPSFKAGLIVYGNNSNNVVIYDYTKNSISMELKGHTDLVNQFVDLGAYQSNYIGTGSDDTTLKIWNIQTGNMVTSFSGHTKCINVIVHLSQLDNGSIIASGSDDKTMRLWSLVSSQCICVIGFESWVKSLLYLKEYKDNIIVHGKTNEIKCIKLIKC